jgi:serine/threonine protein kinase
VVSNTTASSSSSLSLSPHSPLTLPSLSPHSRLTLAIVYELYTRRSLEPNGENWQDLRRGLISFPSSTPVELVTIIQQLMSPDPVDRPTAQLCLHHFTELKTPLEIELERQTAKAMLLEQELQKLMQHQHSSEAR